MNDRVTRPSLGVWSAVSSSPEATEALAQALGARLDAPFVVSLSGGLGAGKTAFTRGFVEGVQPGEGEFVSSPTYAVCHAYETEVPVHHYDLYRLSGEDDLESVGFRDSLDEAIVVVEWPEQVASVRALVDVEAHLRVRDESTRTIELHALSQRGLQALDALAGGWTRER